MNEEEKKTIERIKEDSTFRERKLLKIIEKLQKKNEQVKEILDINIIRGIARDGEKVYNEERCIAVVEQLKELFEKEK